MRIDPYVLMPRSVPVSLTSEGVGRCIYAIAAGQFEADTPVTVTAPFTDPGTNDTRTCSVTFGDGSPPVAGTVNEASGAGIRTATNVYPVTALGPRTIVVTITDDDGASANARVPSSSPCQARHSPSRPAG